MTTNRIRLLSCLIVQQKLTWPPLVHTGRGCELTGTPGTELQKLDQLPIWKVNSHYCSGHMAPLPVQGPTNWPSHSMRNWIKGSQTFQIVAPRPLDFLFSFQISILIIFFSVCMISWSYSVCLSCTALSFLDSCFPSQYISFLFYKQKI